MLLWRFKHTQSFKTERGDMTLWAINRSASVATHFTISLALTFFIFKKNKSILELKYFITMQKEEKKGAVAERLRHHSCDQKVPSSIPRWASVLR